MELLVLVLNGDIIKANYSPWHISLDTRQAMLHCSGDILWLLVDKSGHLGACVRHNSPSLAVFTAHYEKAKSTANVAFLCDLAAFGGNLWNVRIWSLNNFI